MRNGPLFAAINARRARLATVAQRVLDDWQQDEDGIDEVLGSGGACDEIAKALASELVNFGYVDANGQRTSPSLMDGGHEGDEHAWLIAYDDHEAVIVDIPPYVYETGGGYAWRKIPGVHIRPSDITVESIPRSDIEPDADF